jgi:hypothetical protein
MYDQHQIQISARKLTQEIPRLYNDQDINRVAARYSHQNTPNQAQPDQLHIAY